MFYSPVREPSERCGERAISFLEWLNKRPEKCIAVVTHSSFLRHLFAQFGGDSSTEVQQYMHCTKRTYLLVTLLSNVAYSLIMLLNPSYPSTSLCSFFLLILCSHPYSNHRSSL